GSENTPSLSLIDQNKMVRSKIGLTEKGSPVMTLFDERGTRRAALGTTLLGERQEFEPKNTHESSLVLFDAEGNLIWSNQNPGVISNKN
ncbi:MAG: hypothetical protein ACE5I1_19200, partial [bacterium]